MEGDEKDGDHCYLLLRLRLSRHLANYSRHRQTPWLMKDGEDRQHLLKWAIKEVDQDLIKVAVDAAVWPNKPSSSTDQEVAWLPRKPKKICDFAIPRSQSYYKKATYWWIPDIEDKHASMSKILAGP